MKKFNYVLQQKSACVLLTTKIKITGYSKLTKLTNNILYTCSICVLVTPKFVAIFFNSVKNYFFTRYLLEGRIQSDDII